MYKLRDFSSPSSSITHHILLGPATSHWSTYNSNWWCGGSYGYLCDERSPASSWRVLSVLVQKPPATNQALPYEEDPANCGWFWQSTSCVITPEHQGVRTHYVYGHPRCILTNNGSQFTSRLWKPTMTDWRIEHWIALVYNPRANPTKWGNLLTGNHRYNFVDPSSDAHTQHIERGSAKYIEELPSSI